MNTVNKTLAGSSASAPADWPEDAVEVGRIVDAWGLKGWVKVQSFAAEPHALFATRRWFLKPSDKVGVVRAPFPSGKFPEQLQLTQCKEHGELVVAQALEVPDRNSAEALRGARIFVSRSTFPAASIDEFYWVDLIGLAVVNREGERFGTVVGLLDTGPHSVLRVAPDGTPPDGSAAGSVEIALEGERLIPFVAAYVDDVSLAKRVITVDWGLDY